MLATISVLVVDDHPIFAKGLRDTLAEAEDVRVVGMALNGQAALDLVRRHRPDVVLLDLHLPDADGIALLRRMHSDVPVSRVLILTYEEGGLFVQEALGAGAAGYVLKTAEPEAIRRAVREVGRGDAAGVRVIDPAVAAKVPVLTRRPPGWDALTPQEREVARLILEHRGNVTRVAKEMAITANCVRYHLAHVYKKLSCDGLGDLLLQLNTWKLQSNIANDSKTRGEMSMGEDG